MDDCTVCGWELEPDARFCTNCGVPVHRLEPFPEAGYSIPSLSGQGILSQNLAVAGAMPAGGSLAMPVAGAPICPICGKRISLLERVRGCRACAQGARQGTPWVAATPFRAIEDAILGQTDVPANSMMACRELGYGRRLREFRRICEAWGARGAHDEVGVAALHALMVGLELRPGDANFEGLVRRHLYAGCVRLGLPLPMTELREAFGTPVERFPEETVHYFASAVLSEPRISRRQYVRGARPALPTGRGPLRSEVAGTRGDVIAQNEWAATARGVLLLTSRRLHLHPAGRDKRLSIPLADVVSYQRLKDGLVVQRAGRADGYRFTIAADGPPEIFELCLENLLRR